MMMISGWKIAITITVVAASYNCSMAMAAEKYHEEEEEDYSSMMNCDLPKDAVVQILVRLPVRLLLRFRSVCKSWYNFLKSPYFMKLHLNHQISLPPSALVSYPSISYKRMDITFHPLVSNIQQYNFTVNQQFPLPFAIDESKSTALKFEFFCNGLICLMKDKYTSPVVILWNPATRIYKCISIPSDCPTVTYLKFGFHRQSNEYKIFKVPFMTRSDDESSKMAWVYTLSSDSWKTVPFSLLSITVAWGSQISLDDCVYWLATSSSPVEYIICFDLIKEEFKLLDVPDDYGFDRKLVRRRLMVVRGSLAMIVSVDDGSTDTEMWVLMNKSSGVQLDYSWSKKFIIEPFSKNTIPLGLWKDDKLLVCILQFGVLKQVYSYDLVTRKMKYFHMPKEQDFASFASTHWFYFESFELGDGHGFRRY